MRPELLLLCAAVASAAYIVPGAPISELARRRLPSPTCDVIEDIAAAAIDDEEKEMINSIAGPRAAGYGEMLPQGMRALIARTRLGRNDTFVDVGSGTGKLVLQAAADSGVARSVGVELSPTRHALAQQALDERIAQGADYASRVAFICGDAIADPAALEAIGSSTVIFCNNLLLGDETQAKLAQLLEEAPSLRAVVTSQPFAYPGLQGFALGEQTLACAMSWQVPLRQWEPMPPGYPCAVYERRKE